jgi:hypothetical protein
MQAGGPAQAISSAAGHQLGHARSNHADPLIVIA